MVKIEFTSTNERILIAGQFNLTLDKIYQQLLLIPFFIEINF